MDSGSYNPYRAPESERRAGPQDPVPLQEAATRLASRKSRLTAVLIDWGLMYAVLVPLQAASGVYRGARLDRDETRLESVIWAGVALSVYLVLHGYLLHRRGQTIGKLLLRIRVVDARDRTKPSLGRLMLLRVVPFQLAVLVPDFWLVVLLANYLPIFRDEQRCLHDYTARTIVVQSA